MATMRITNVSRETFDEEGTLSTTLSTGSYDVEQFKENLTTFMKTAGFNLVTRDQVAMLGTQMGNTEEQESDPDSVEDEEKIKEKYADAFDAAIEISGGSVNRDKADKSGANTARLAWPHVERLKEVAYVLADAKNEDDKQHRDDIIDNAYELLRQLAKDVMDQ